MKLSVNRKPLFISLSTDAYSINIHTRTQQARVFNTQWQLAGGGIISTEYIIRMR